MWLLPRRAEQAFRSTVCATQKALQSNDMPPSPSSNPTLLKLVCLFTSHHPSVYSASQPLPSLPSRPLPRPFLSPPSKPSNLQTSFLSPHKGRYVRLCVTLVVPCPAHVLAVSPLSPAPTFSPRPSSPPPDCNNVSKCGSACC